MMTLEELGDLLRQERERREMSLETAASEMKISKRYLIALEEARTEHLPHPVYAKGFLKSYARLLGLDPEELGAVFEYYHVQDDSGDIFHAHTKGGKAAAKSGQPIVKSDKAADGNPPRTKQDDAATRQARRAMAEARVPATGDKTRGFRPPLWLVAPLIVVFAGLAWFFFANFGSTGGDTGGGNVGKTGGVAAVSPGAASTPAAGQKPDIPAGDNRQQSGQSGQSGQAGQAGQPGAAPGAQSWAASPPADAQSPAGQAASPEKMASEAQFASNGKQTVEINAGKQAAGLEVSTEDGQTRSFTLVKGQRLSLRFNDKISVRFGHAPSVAVKVNGKEYPLGSGAATNKSITFP